MKYQSLKKFQKLTVAFVTVMALAAVANAGGSHAGAAPLNTFNKIKAIAADAGQFQIQSIKEVSVPTTATTVISHTCTMASGELPYVDCPMTVPGDYVKAYRVTVGYVSKSTKLASDEYPEGDNWTEDFNFSTDELSAETIANLPSSGKTRKAALQSLFQVTKGVQSYATTALLSECKRIPAPNTSVDANAYIVVPAGCQDQVGPVNVQETVIKISLKNNN